MTTTHRRIASGGCLALAGAIVLLASLSSARAGASAMVECQHPVVTGVEVYKLHDITSSRACRVALARYRGENASSGDHARALYSCRGDGRPVLRLHSFEGWHLALTPYFVMSSHGASFAVTGTDFPISCI